MSSDTKLALLWIVISCVSYEVAATACSASFAPIYKAPPCGYHGHACGNGMCCGESEDCGGDPNNPGCPAGSCCAAGELVGKARDAGPG